MLDALWARGSATVRELVEGGCDDLAYTTVMTTLDRLFKKGFLTRSEENRAFRYVPRLSREELHREDGWPCVSPVAGCGSGFVFAAFVPGGNPRANGTSNCSTICRNWSNASAANWVKRK